MLYYQGMNYKIIGLPEHISRAGKIVVMENLEFKRIFFIFTSGSLGGGHAHKKCRQMLIAVRGSFFIRMYDGVRFDKILLDNHNDGLLVEPMMWLEYQGSDGGILAVLCSHKYDEDDYIRNFGEYESAVS